jgi:6-phosphogluconolactonase (cycloisomerase 2 family)
MKPIITLSILILILLLSTIIGCGGSSNGGPHIGHPIGPFLFTVGQTSDSLFSFQGSDSGAIFPIASTSTGGAPAAVVMQGFDIDTFNLYVADSAANNVTVLKLNATSGMASSTGIIVPVGSNPMALGLRQASGNVVANAPIDRGTLYVLNQGSNGISGFNITDTAGHMTGVTGSPFATQANPQALVVVTGGTSPANISTFVYVANGALGSISGFKANADGSLTEVAGSPFTVGANISALAGRAGGTILLASDAGNNKLLGFKISDTGVLTAFPGSPFPAGSQPGAINFAFNDFVYVANRGSNNVSGYKFDFTNSTLTPVPGSPFATGTAPVALGTTRPLQLYVANQGSSDMSAFNIDLNSGALTPVAGSPFHLPASPSAIQTLFVMNVD